MNQSNLQLQPESRSRLTAAEYWEECQNLDVQIEDAISIFHTYEEINRLGLEQSRVLDTLNKDALFWNVTSYSLQTALFVILARIFDTSPDAHSIHRLVRMALEQPELFSRDALKARKMRRATDEPEWLEHFLDQAWFPDGADDIRRLKKALSSHFKKFEDVYSPIRHTYIAHRVITREQAFALFQRTNRGELGEILEFLYDLVNSITQLYLNGIRPELGKRSVQYERNIERIRSSTRNVIARLLEGEADDLT